MSGDDPAPVRRLDVVRAAAAVLLVGASLFAVSGVWPPMVAVESGSMQPTIHRGDLVFIAEAHRFAPSGTAGESGVVTRRSGARVGYRTFGDHGDVIVFRPDGDPGETPIIHRAHFWVNESEDWYDKADPAHLSGGSCGEVPNCPAPHAGFVTKGDASDRYDQVRGISGPVRPEWIAGTAELRVPYLGHVRLAAA